MLQHKYTKKVKEMSNIIKEIYLEKDNRYVTISFETLERIPQLVGLG